MTVSEAPPRSNAISNPLNSGAVSAVDRSRTALQGAAVAVAIFATFLALIWPQFMDPFAQSDEWPAITPAPELFYWKTLAEGRWVNYWWMLRSWPVHPATLFAIYMACLSVAVAFTGVGLFRQDGFPGRAFTVALALALAPSTSLISLWFSTLIPVTAALAVFAVVTALCSFRVMLACLAVLVPVALMGHTTYPMVLLGIAMLAANWPERRGAIWELAGVFTAAMVVGMVLMFSINLAVHDHFGVRSDFRFNQTPLSDIDSALANLWSAILWWRDMLGAIMLGTQLGWVIVLGLLALAVAALAPVSWSIVLRVLVVAFLMAGFGAAPALLKGLETPFRGMLFAWVLLVGVCALVVRDSPRFGRRLVFQLVLYGAVAIGVVWWNKPYRLDLPPFQAMSADLADRVDAVGQGRAEVLVIGGQVHAIREMTAVQFSVGLQFRLQSLRQWSVAICDAQAEDALLLVRARSKIDKSDPKIEDTAWRSVYETYAATCADHMEALRALPVYPAEGSLALIAPGVVGLNLPPLRLADQPP